MKTGLLKRLTSIRDQLTQLIEFNEESQESKGADWIPVSEQLPYFGLAVQVKSTEGEFDAALNGNIPDEYWIYSRETPYSRVATEVTHWRPILPMTREECAPSTAVKAKTK